MIGLFDAVWTNEELVVPQLCAVVQFVGGIGEIPMRVRITEARTGRVVYTTPEHRLSFSSRNRTVYGCFRIRKCRVSRPGIHFVELFIRDRFVDDRRLRIRESRED